MKANSEKASRQLSPDERAALIAAAREQARRDEARDAIVRRSVGEPVRASFSQERLWFLSQLEPKSPVYNVPVGFLIRGPLDVVTLKRSLADMMQRHDTLRTKFPTIDGVPWQVVSPHAALEMPLVSLEEIPEADRRKAAERLAAAEARRPFVLDQGPLIRATLVRLSAGAHALVLVMHHIISDGWSFSILVREIAAAYDARTTGRPLVLAELPVRYADYAHWQRERLTGDVLAGLLDFWRGQLAGAVPVLTWPTDRSRAADAAFSGARLMFQLPPDLSRTVQRFSEDRGVTLFVTVLAAFMTLLHRYSGETDIVIGSPVANRSRAEVEGIIGFFANTIVLRARVDGADSFAKLVERVRDVTYDAVAHEDLPFERLVEEIQRERDLRRNPVFQAMLVHQAPLPPLRLSQLDVEIWDLESGTSKFDLTLNVWLQDGAIRGFFEYAADLFDEAAITRMAGHLTTLIRSVVAHPDQRLSEARLLTDAEHDRAVREWNDTAVPYPSDRCLHRLIDDHAARCPDAVAVIAGDEQWTYAEVNRRANQLARYLRRHGVGLDVPVGLCLERSIDVPIGILAILKAGGAYVPLDLDYPAERLAFMVADADLPALITSGGRELPHGDGVRVIDLGAQATRIVEEDASEPDVRVQPDNLAYVIYTSGSTGAPKGVLLNHRGRVNNFTDFNRRFAIGSGDKLLAVSSLSFDMCAYDMLGTLAAGAAVVLSGARTHDPARWITLMNECRVTVWHSAPALLEMMLDECLRRQLRLPQSLRCVLLGGDWIPVSLPDRLRALVPGAVIVSLGGATEVSMDSILHLVEAADASRRSIPYGRPMANQSAYILSPERTLVPVGVIGELHLGGDGVGYGYLNRAALTADRFVPHPFSRIPGDRLYRTGDLARYMADGTIELIGRKDLQVKIRGLRVELEEIADALRRHPEIHDAAVTKAEENGTQHLVAHIVTPASDVQQLRLQAFLRQRLPDYMVPSVIIPWAALPLTPNGKLDRRALGRAPLPRVDGVSQYVAPRSPVEEVVAAIWLDVLQVPRASVTDNFFALRGHSLLAARVMSRLTEYFQVDLPLRAIFESPTIAELADRVERVCRAAGENATHVARMLLEINDLTEEQVRLRLAGESSPQ